MPKEDAVTAILLLSCTDQKGLVASVSDFLYRHNGNIIHADQHTDPEQRVFLQRVEWEIRDFAIPREEIAASFRPIAQRFGMTWRLSFSDYTPRVALFVSRLAHCMHDLLARWRMGELRAAFPLVVSNHPDLQPLAEMFGLAYEFLPVTSESRASQERRIIERLREEKIDFLVLARYMQIVGDDLLEAYPNRIINIHHSFLPAFVGARPYHQAYERGVKIIGATAHYATHELDQGPIIAQEVVRVSHRDSVEDLARKGRDLEKVVLARAVDLHVRDRVIVYGNKTVAFD